MLVATVMQGGLHLIPIICKPSELNYNISGPLYHLLLLPYTSSGRLPRLIIRPITKCHRNITEVRLTVPAFMEEGFYDGVEALGQLPTTLMLRKQAYWTVSAGGLPATREVLSTTIPYRLAIRIRRHSSHAIGVLGGSRYDLLHGITSRPI